MSTQIKEKKTILTVCFSCGKKYGDGKIDKKFAIGSWIDNCDICGDKTGCASAPHDFGIYSNERIKIDDKVQDLI